ncbi:MAG: thioredoxin family protein [Polaribacter sp.]
MTKFGELISEQKPILIDFYTEWGAATDSTMETLKTVAAVLGDSVKVVKIDIQKNQILADALQVKENSTFMIYKNSEMIWRQTGVQDAKTLINLVKQYL